MCIIIDNLLSLVIENCSHFCSDQELSFFEFITACAFELFSKNISDFNDDNNTNLDNLIDTYDKIFLSIDSLIYI